MPIVPYLVLSAISKQTRKISVLAENMFQWHGEKGQIAFFFIALITF